MSVPAAEPHTAATAAALTAAGLLVGRGKKPDGAGWQGEPGTSAFRAYVVLYPDPGMFDGVLGDPWESLDYRVQASCFAAAQDGAEKVADRVKATLVGRKITVEGRGMYPFQLDGGSSATRDDQVAPPIHFVPLILSARSGPA